MKYKKTLIVDKSGNAYLVPVKRSYASADITDITRDWLMPNTSGNAELRASLSAVRRRARETERNHPYYEHHLNLQIINLIGPPGIMPQMLLTKPDGTFDDERNQKIEAAFRRWGRMENCSIDGLRSWIDLQKLLVRCLDRDGEILFLKFEGAQYGPYGFQLKPLEGDHLDETYFAQMTNGNYVHMGIECNPDGKPVAYHILTSHPGDYYQSGGYHQRIRYPAERVIHVFDPTRRTSQNRGISKGVSTLRTLHNQEAAEEATLIAYRAAACQSGFLERSIDSAAGDIVGDAEDEDTGEVFFELEPGIYRKLPAGFKFVPHNPTFPTTQYQEFSKHLLRKSSAGLGSPYHSLSGDLESVNYSSIRSGTIDFRDSCRMMQKFIEEHFCEQVFPDWLRMAMISNKLDLPFSDFDELVDPENRMWQTRGWEWVDPESDTNASIKQNDAGLISKTEIIAQRGGNIEDVWRTIARERDLRKKYGLAFGSTLNFDSVVKPAEPPKDFGRSEIQDPEFEMGSRSLISEKEEELMNTELERIRSDQIREIRDITDSNSVLLYDTQREVRDLAKRLQRLEEQLPIIFIRSIEDSLSALAEEFKEIIKDAIEEEKSAFVKGVVAAMKKKLKMMDDMMEEMDEDEMKMKKKKAKARMDEEEMDEDEMKMKKKEAMMDKEEMDDMMEEMMGANRMIKTQKKKKNKRAEEPAEVQTIIFSKEEFPDKEDVIKWLRDHEFKDDLDETEDSWRARQFPPGQCKEDTYGTREIEKGVTFVFCVKQSE